MDCNTFSDVLLMLGQLGLLTVISVLYYVRKRLLDGLKDEIGKEFDRILDERSSSEYRDQRPTPPPFNTLV